MPTPERITAAADVPENGSYLFTVRDDEGRDEEAVLVRHEDGIAAWLNFCQHETDQRLDTGRGAAMRDGQIICPRHGSMFDAETGYCDNGKASGSYLAGLEITVERGVVYLVDDGWSFDHDGGLDDDPPGSTSHLTF